MFRIPDNGLKRVREGGSRGFGSRRNLPQATIAAPGDAAKPGNNYN